LSPEDLSNATRSLPARPLLPKTFSCRLVVEGRVRSLPAAASAVLAVLICLRVAVADPAAGAYTVRLRPQVTVKSTAPMLGDIADLSGDDEGLVGQLARTSLGPITDIRIFSRAEILSQIRTGVSGIEDVLLTGSDFTRVSVAMRTPEASEISAILKTYLTSVTRWRAEEIEIRSIDNLKSIAIPQGDMELRVVSRGSPASYRNALISIEATLDGKFVRTFWVKADVRVRAQVVRVAKPLPYRTVLKADDLLEAVCDIEDPRPAYIRSAAEAVGMTTRRALGQGEFLSLGCVDEASLVRSGETVRLLVRNGILNMTVLARALQSGKLGEPIKVRNIDSERVIMAVVTGRGEVRVAN
jgi:flagellar basal body P-ring formation protein FlgA